MGNSLAELKKIFKYFNYDFTNTKTKEQQIKLISEFANETNLAVLIIDVSVNLPVYTSPGYYNLFGDKSDAIHPDDYESVLNSSVVSLNYLISNDLNIAEYRLVRKYRAMVKGEYLVCIEQVRIIDFDSVGHPWLALVVVDISPDQHFSGTVEFKLVNVVTGVIVLPLETENSSQILTFREIEILRLIGEGFVSKEIADRLNITLNTVNTHRQHILEKLNVRTSLEAVRYALDMAILQ